MAFVDGENLTARFEAMVKDGRKARTPREDRLLHSNIRHVSNRFVWSDGTIWGIPAQDDLVRVHYYTTFTGGNDEFEKFTEELGALTVARFQDEGQWIARDNQPVIPRVFKKEARNTRTKSVDINLCVDVLDYVRQDALDSVYLVTGDVDYLPLIEAVMRAGKRIYLAALSSGLSSRLRYGVDKFISLDRTYFSDQ